MHLKKYVLLVCLFFIGMGFSFGNPTDSAEIDTIFTDSFRYLVFKNPFKHKSNTWVNVPNGYTAFDSSTSIQVSGMYGISLNGNAELVTIMAPESGSYSNNEPFIVVLYYPGFIPTEVTLNNLDKEDIYNALSTEKNARANVHWLFNDWIIDETKFDRKRNLFKMNAFYKYDGEFEFAQRQIAYWQFGNKGIYHYVWICPERKIYQYQPPRTELDNLLGVLPSFSYAKHDENFPYSENLTLEDVICMEDLGPTGGIYADVEAPSQSPNTDGPVDVDIRPTPSPAFGLPALIVFVSKLNSYQIGAFIGVPFITTLVIFLFNSSIGKRKKKEVPWD